MYDTRTGKTAPMFPESSVFNTDATWSPDGKKFCCTLVASTNKGGLYTFDFNEADIGVRPEIKEVPLYISPCTGRGWSILTSLPSATMTARGMRHIHI